MKSFQLIEPDEDHANRVYAAKSADDAGLLELLTAFPNAMDGMYLPIDHWLVQDAEGPRTVAMADHAFRHYYKEC
ncbi:MAG TPA: hypothetical protein VGL56_15845 [Fimbriimonadaceae bacterium]|jgi:hypothetical protein